MIERFSTNDKVLLGGALIMASGTLFPIVKMPIVGSMNYIAGGKGDGIVVLGRAIAIVLAGLYAYRRTAAALGVAALCIMGHTLVGLLAILEKARSAPVPKNNPFSGLGNILINSVGIEWGWLPLIGGALAVIVAGLLSTPIKIAGIASKEPAFQSAAFSTESADAAIAAYIDSQKRSPSTKAAPSPGFGKRSI